MPGYEPSGKRSFGGRFGRILFWVGVRATFACLAFVGVLVLCLLVLLQRPVAVPAWLHSMAQTQIAHSVAGYEIRFSEIFLALEGLVPRLRFAQLRLLPTQGDGVPVQGDGAAPSLLEISEADLVLSPMPLLQGRLAPNRLDLQEVVLNLGGEGAELAPANGWGQGVSFIAQSLGQAFQQPILASLRRVETKALTLRFESAETGRSQVVEAQNLRLELEGEHLSARAELLLPAREGRRGVLALDYGQNLPTQAVEYGVRFANVRPADLAAQLPAFPWLGMLQAAVSGELRGVMEAPDRPAVLRASLQIGEGILQTGGQTPPLPLYGAGGSFSYTPQTGLLRLEPFFVQSAWFSATVTGDATVRAAPEGGRAEVTGQFAVTDLTANPMEAYAQPLTLGRITADLQLNTHPLEVHVHELRLADKGHTLVAHGQLSHGGGSWEIALQGGMESIGTARFMAFWPPNLFPVTREWILNNIEAEQLQDLNFAMRAQPGTPADLYADFRFADAQIRFLPSMPPAQNVAGFARLEGERFTAKAQAGWVEAGANQPIDASGTVFEVPQINAGDPSSIVALIDLRGAGTLESMLTLLERPPFGFLSALGMPADVATSAQAQVQGRLEVPLIKTVTPEQIRFDMRATAQQVQSQALLPGKSLIIEELALIARSPEPGTTELRLTGEGQVGAIPISGQWVAQFGKNQEQGTLLEAQLPLDLETFREFGFDVPLANAQGQAAARVQISTKLEQAARFELTSDLQGLALTLPMLDWRKPADAQGVLRLGGQWGFPLNAVEFSLSGAGLEATGNLQTGPDGRIDRLQLAPLRVGEWLDVRASVQQAASTAPNLRIESGTLDLRHIPPGLMQGGGGSSKTPVRINLDRLQVNRQLAVEDFSGVFAAAGGVSGQFSGMLAGSAAIEGSIMPESAGGVVEIRSQNAAEILRTLGILDRGRGGLFTLTLAPEGEPGHYQARMEVESIRVLGASILLQLLNTLTVVGVIEQLTGSGIFFSSINASFCLTPTHLMLQHASAVGPSLGLSLDGFYEFASREMDMRGVVSPLYAVNALGRPIAREGEGLFGFNYRMRGPAEDLRITVNPLSALLPGALRNIFRFNSTPTPAKC